MLLVSLSSQHGAALVFSALFASAVGQLPLTTIRASGNASRGQKIVAAALRGALLGMTPFRIRHGKPLNKLIGKANLPLPDEDIRIYCGA